MSRDYVLVTFYREQPGERPVIHSYGPFTRAQASYRRRRLLEASFAEALGAEFHVSACRIIDIDAMNA